VTQLRHQFLTFGSGHQGTITREEFEQALAPFGMSKHKVEEIFCSIDLNGDGLIAYSEFIAAAISDPERLEEATLRLTFDRFDADGSGMITTGNVREVLGGAYEEHGAEELVRDADSNGDGAVTFKDFCNYLKHQRSQTWCQGEPSMLASTDSDDPTELAQQLSSLSLGAEPLPESDLRRCAPQHKQSQFRKRDKPTLGPEGCSLSDADTQASTPEKSRVPEPNSEGLQADAPWYRHITSFAWAYR